MKSLITTGLILSSFSLIINCQKSQQFKNKTGLTQGDCFKGILVKKGICGQRVVKINSVAKNGIAYAANWQDEGSGKTYKNVFTVENVCSFPSTINEGGEFNFKLTSIKDSDCMQCQAFTPVPKEKNSIIVSSDCGTGNN